MDRSKLTQHQDLVPGVISEDLAFVFDPPLVRAVRFSGVEDAFDRGPNFETAIVI